MCLTELSLDWMMAMAGSTVSVPLEQAPWLGQPSHADCFPASSDSTPGQLELALSGT